MVIIDLHAPICEIWQKQAADAAQLHERAHPASHLQRQPTADQSKRPRNTPPTNQRLSHGFKGPQIGGNRLNLPPNTLYPLGDPLGSVLDERRHETWHPRVGRPTRWPEPRLKPVQVHFGEKIDLILLKAVPWCFLVYGDAE